MNELATLTTTSAQVREGGRIVTVGRDGADHDKHGNGIYTTKVYEALPRVRDGVLTWRLASSLSGHRTSGKGITGPMMERAESYAIDQGLPFRAGIVHGTIAR